MRDSARGALAGLIATIPMTLVMTLLFRRLPAGQQYPLPPVLITGALADRTGKPLAGSALGAAALVAHFGYGAATGALYPRLLPRGWPPVLTGPGYGVAVWSASYLGWIPALRILTPATRHPARRNALMLAAHLVWGAALAGCLALDARRHGSEGPSARFATAARAVAPRQSSRRAIGNRFLPNS